METNNQDERRVFFSPSEGEGGDFQRGSQQLSATTVASTEPPAFPSSLETY